MVIDEVFKVLCEKKRVGEGLRMLRKVTRIEGFEASQRSYELMIQEFCEKGEMETAMKIQAEMAGKGFVVNSKVYGLFC